MNDVFQILWSNKSKTIKKIPPKKEWYAFFFKKRAVFMGYLTLFALTKWADLKTGKGWYPPKYLGFGLG